MKPPAQVLPRAQISPTPAEEVDAGRAAIVSAAAQLFGSKGFNATRMTDVAARAEVSPTTIYAKFASKRALYEAATGSAPPEIEASGSRATARGRRTRERLLAAGRAEFERQGYARLRISEVCKAAQVATPTFYNYFPAKSLFFREIVIAATEDLTGTVASTPAPAPSPGEAIEDAVRRAREFYLSRGALLRVLEEAASASSEMATLRAAIRAPVLRRATRIIDRWQRDGLVDDGLTAETVAQAALALVERFLADEDASGDREDRDDPVAVTTSLVSRCLGLRSGARPA
jgi:AcrR family transcriptional regulator